METNLTIDRLSPNVLAAKHPLDGLPENELEPSDQKFDGVVVWDFEMALCGLEQPEAAKLLSQFMMSGDDHVND